MSKYIKLNSAIRILWELCLPLCDYENGVKQLENMPTIDIVRCKECMHKYVTGTTTQYYVCDFMDAQHDENGYCHHGERAEQ